MKKLISAPRLQKAAAKAARMIRPLAQILTIAASLQEDAIRSRKAPARGRAVRRQFKAGKDL